MTKYVPLLTIVAKIIYCVCVGGGVTGTPMLGALALYYFYFFYQESSFFSGCVAYKFTFRKILWIG